MQPDMRKSASLAPDMAAIAFSQIFMRLEMLFLLFSADVAAKLLRSEGKKIIKRLT